MKRRKADEIKRYFLCGDQNCQKQYGSYPALYTHIKLKHKGIEPEGTIKSIYQIKEQIKIYELQKMSSSNEQTLESQLLKTVNHFTQEQSMSKHASRRKSSSEYLSLSQTNRLIRFLDKVALNVKETLFKELCGVAELVNHCIEQRKGVKSFLEAREDFDEISQYVEDYVEYGKDGKFKLVATKKFVQEIVWVFINVLFLRN